ncbi:MAG: hypothetical protein MMC23_009578 [Stictis urceolatum]|nr:hypothetical protein [Stictis urceolata]
MPTAIVTGATGILGREIVHHLAKDPETWTSVHALSRSQKEAYPSNVKHDTIDLTGDASTMAKQLAGVEASHVFFAAYLQGDSEQANWDTNGAMLHNFISALSETGATKLLKRFILVTGAKQYGLHLGRVKTPMEESDPRIDGPGRPPNFYYRQQDILAEEAHKGGWDWVVTYPNDVVGLASNNFMNLATSLGLYAAVSRELCGELEWPGSEAFYSMATTFTASKLHAHFCVWAALAPGAANQAFNVINGDVQTWENLWPKLARRFGCRVPQGQFAREPNSDSATSMQLADKPPLLDYAAAKAGLVSSQNMRPSVVEARIDLEKWSRRPEVKAAWERLALNEGLGMFIVLDFLWQARQEHKLTLVADLDLFDKATWWFLKFVLGRNFEILISGSKAREFGYTGFKDTWASFEEVFQELEDAKILPKTRLT